MLQTEVAGLAAMSICESLLLCLSERNILNEKDVIGILEDAVAGHRDGQAEGSNSMLHKAAADLITGIIEGGNTVRHPR